MIYYDFERDEIVTAEKLEQEYHEAYKNGWIEPCTFNTYKSNCMYWNNGSLIPFQTEAEMRSYMLRQQEAFV